MARVSEAEIHDRPEHLADVSVSLDLAPRWSGFARQSDIEAKTWRAYLMRKEKIIQTHRATFLAFGPSKARVE